MKKILVVLTCLFMLSASTALSQDLCDSYLSRYQVCVEKRNAGSEVDYNTCKNLSSSGDEACEAAGCTWYVNSPSNIFPCMLDLCLMDWDGSNGVGALDFGIFKREQGRGPCPTPDAPFCQKLFNKYQTCLSLHSAGSEMDYNVCKNLSSQGSTICQNAGCTWYVNSPTNIFPCMLDMCLMDWDGTNGVGAIDFGIHRREAGRGPCPTTHQAEDDLCQMYDNKYQTCITLQTAGRKVAYNVCKPIEDEGDCTAAGCTWYQNSPNQAYTCMLDICLTDWDGTNGVGALDRGIFKR